MILRRLATAIRRQDWFTVVIEFVIVVTGVLFALQVNNWNEGRLEREREQAALDRLQHEFSGILQSLSTAIPMCPSAPPRIDVEWRGCFLKMRTIKSTLK